MNPPPSPPAPSAELRRHSSPLGLLPWAVAAGLAITTAALWSERDGLSKDAAALRDEALTLRTRDVLAKVKVTVLAPQDEAYAKAVAVVVWDAEKQQGLVRFANMPRLAAGDSYQLSISDPKYPQPVSAGGVPVGDDGSARVAFTPAHTIRAAEKFAISIERAGGASVPLGPIVLLGD